MLGSFGSSQASLQRNSGGVDSEWFNLATRPRATADRCKSQQARDSRFVGNNALCCQLTQSARTARNNSFVFRLDLPCSDMSGEKHTNPRLIDSVASPARPLQTLTASSYTVQHISLPRPQLAPAYDFPPRHSHATL